MVLLRASADAWRSPSLVSGHRFGRWLVIEPEPGASEAARAALENACLFDQTGASEDAIEVLNQALERERTCASLYEARGALYLVNDFPRAAAGDFQRATSLEPNSPIAWFALGRAYEILSLARQAVEALAQAEKLGCDHAELHLVRARAERRLGRCGLAARHFTLALEREPAPEFEHLIEAAQLANEDREHAPQVERVRDRIDACRGVQLSEKARLLRALFRESPGKTPETLALDVQALEPGPGELGRMATGLLEALELSVPETRLEASARLLAAEPDPERRAALAACLARTD